MNVSTAQRNSMPKGVSMIWVGTLVPYSTLSIKGGKRDVRIRIEQGHNTGFAGEDITVRSLWEGGSGG